jgi:gamma-glutamylcyclotransferase (GGCT)/AIG2-like uncharacterized protein YtfP
MYYFAYGSNMSLEHMRRICGWHCQFLGRARLSGYGNCLDKRGFLNIDPQENAEIFGILYSVDEDGLGMLDDFEGYPTVFDRKEVTVFDDHNIKYKAQVYIEPVGNCGGMQYRQEYFRRVIAAAYENRLPEEYIKKIESLIEGKEKI